MILLISVIFTFFLFLIIYIFKDDSNDTFSPINLSIIFIFITNVPYMISLHFNYNLLNESIQARISYNELPVSLLKYTLLLILSTFFLVQGIKSNTSYKIANKIPVLLHNESEQRYKLSGYTAIIIGLVSYTAFFDKAGGFSNWISNLNSRASFTTGNGYLMNLMGLLPIGLYIYIYTFRYKKNLFKYLLCIFLFIIVFLLTTTLGGRKSSLFLIAYSLIVWNYGVKKVKNISTKIVFLIPFISIYVLAVPILRTSSEKMELYFNNPENLIEEVGKDINTLTKQVSYIDHQLLIMDYFNVNNIWLGKSYIDLLYAPIPRSVYSEKPPVDDGVYIRSIAAGYDVEPPQAYDTMYQSSWPPETFGAAYMNFSFMGVLISMYFLGIVYGITYSYMKKSNFSLFSILIYGNVITNFQFSNLRIIQTLSYLILLLFFFSLFFPVKKRKKQY